MLLLLSIAIANDQLPIIALRSLKLNNKGPINSGRPVYASCCGARVKRREGEMEDGTAAR